MDHVNVIERTVLERLLEEIKKKTSWGKNELIDLFARVTASQPLPVDDFKTIGTFYVICVENGRNRWRIWEGYHPLEIAIQRPDISVLHWKRVPKEVGLQMQKTFDSIPNAG